MSADVGEIACIRPQITPVHCLKTVVPYRQMPGQFQAFIIERAETFERLAAEPGKGQKTGIPVLPVCCMELARKKDE